MLQKLKARYGFQCCTGGCLKHSKLAPGNVGMLGDKEIPRNLKGGARSRGICNILNEPKRTQHIFRMSALLKHQFNIAMQS